MANTIITIARQYGSGGREIGALVAKELGISFYDHELITMAAEKSDLCREAEERNAHADLARFARGAERIGHARKRLATHAAAVIADRHPEFAVRVLEERDADMFSARRDRILHDV